MGMLLLFIALLIILFFMGGKHESHLQSHLESSEEQLCRRFGNRGDSEKKWGVRVIIGECGTAKKHSNH